MQLGHSRWFPWPAKKSFEQRLQVFLTINPERLRVAWIQSGGYGIRAGVGEDCMLKKPCIAANSSAVPTEHDLSLPLLHTSFLTIVPVVRLGEAQAHRHLALAT